MTKLIVRVVFGGTKQDYAISGASADSVMKKLRKMREVRAASCFVFYNRKTGKMVDSRMN